MKPIVEILRVEESDQGTRGVLRIGKVAFCVTLEPRDEENATNISSIPAQQYICKRVETPKHGECFQVMNVPGRTSVLFHVGNTDKDTQGCIILGEKFGEVNSKAAVLSSRGAIYQFMLAMEPYDEFHLTITEHF
jgi:hypothetical protein